MAGHDEHYWIWYFYAGDLGTGTAINTSRKFFLTVEFKVKRG
jgi:hypothetical protein